jgi:hypothetical protein
VKDVVLTKDTVEYGKDYISFTLPNLSLAAGKLQYHYQSGYNEATPGCWLNQPTLGDQNAAAAISADTIDMLLPVRYQHKNMLHFLLRNQEKAIKTVAADKLSEEEVAKAQNLAKALAKDASDSSADESED